MSKQSTRAGIELESFYGSGSAEQPGEFPFTRGRFAQTKAGGWQQRELSGEGDGRRSNEQIKYLLALGQNGIDIIGDGPTMSMFDADHPLLASSIGTQGVSLCCRQDYIDLFKDIPLDQVAVSSSVPSLVSLAGLLCAAKHYGFDPSTLRGSVLQMPLYGEDCTYANHLPVDLRVRLSLDCMEYCAVHMPKFHAYVEDTYFFSESGLDAVEETALGIIEIRHLTRKLIERGINVDAFAPRIAILVDCGMDFFEEVAKIRAIRRLFAKIMRDEFGAQDPRSQTVVVTSHTSGLSLTAQQPVNNIVRGTLQALSLVFGGAHAIEISTFDEAYRTPSKEGHLIGLRTQQIIEAESGVTRVVDPLGGSYFVEELTDAVEARVLARIEEIEKAGDPETLQQQGYFKKIFHTAMEDNQLAVQKGDLSIIGVNAHLVDGEEDTMLKDIAETKIEPCKRQINRVADLKQTRDQAMANQSLTELARAVKDGKNLVPVVMACFEANVTVGEMSGTMRQATAQPYDPFGMIEPLIEVSA